MEITIEGFLVNSPEDIKKVQIIPTSENYFKVKSKINFERNKLIKYLSGLKENGLIKSVYRPKNKKLQEHLDNVCKAKRQMKASIEKLDAIFG